MSWACLVGCMVPGKVKGVVGRGSRSKWDARCVPFFLYRKLRSHSGIIMNHAVCGEQYFLCRSKVDKTGPSCASQKNILSKCSHSDVIIKHGVHGELSQ